MILLFFMIYGAIIHIFELFNKMSYINGFLDVPQLQCISDKLSMVWCLLVYIWFANIEILADAFLEIGIVFSLFYFIRFCYHDYTNVVK